MRKMILREHFSESKDIENWCVKNRNEQGTDMSIPSVERKVKKAGEWRNWQTQRT
ncbi:MAG: hypothetical protein KJ864_06050 [Candidatus Omnitrophica bacterium]|nr:hypothetical protein [Candidatus Omnitrophota bacterium]